MPDEMLLDVDEDVPASAGRTPVTSRLYARWTATSFPALLSRFSPDGTTKPTLSDSAGGDDESENQRKTTATEPTVPFYKRKWFIIMNIVVALLSIAILFVLLYPVAHAIAQRIVDAAVLNVDEAVLTNPTNQSFDLSLNAWVSHGGIFSATVSFNEPISVAWMNSTGGQVHLGSFVLDPLTVQNKRAYINGTVPFTIDDEDAFSQFASALITQPNFTWHLESKKVDVRALTFLTAHNLNFQKDVVLSGMNNFRDSITLVDLQLPMDAPNGGGIEFVAVTGIQNPSPFSINLGTVSFELSYNGLYLGTGTGFNTTVGAGGSNVTLQGTLVPQKGSDSLSKVSQLFTEYLNAGSPQVVAKGKSAFQNSGRAVSWLNSALAFLELHVPFKAPEPINPIKSITIGYMALAFSEQDTWAPMASSRSVQAELELPFGFGVDIGQLSNAFNITNGGGVVGSLSAPPSASASRIGVVNTTCTRGIVNITIDSTRLDVLNANHQVFSAFTRDLTNSMSLPFQLEGTARAVANTSIGELTLDPIQFNVTSGLTGLQGLKSLVEIGTIDVVGGSSQAIQLNIPVSIHNPSNLELSTGDLTLQLFRGGAFLGTTLIPNMTLQRGNNSLLAVGNFTMSLYSPWDFDEPLIRVLQPNSTPQGQQTLNDFIGGTDVEVAISGYSQSTTIESLISAFESLNISATIPALKANLSGPSSLTNDRVSGPGATLISSASLVFSTDIAHSGLAQASFTLANPFTASINLLRVNATAMYGNLTLGKIDNVDRSSDPIHANGHATVTSPALPFSMNMDPSLIIEFLLMAAQKNHIDLGPLLSMLEVAVQNSGTQSTVKVTVDTSKPSCVSGHQFDVNGAVLSALENLEVTLAVNSSVKIDDYPTELSFTQSDVKTVTDDTALYLIGVVAPPIVQQLVDQAILSFSQANITNISDEGFDLSLKGALTNTGPFDAQIAFVEPVSVTWQGQDIATISLLPVCMAANDGVPDYETTAHLTITNTHVFTEFATVLLHSPDFDWTISTNALRVTAVGTIFDGVSFSKNVSFKAFNNLPGVTISNFRLPSDDPAGGIHIETDSLIPSSANLGIDLGTVTFEASFKGTTLGPLSSADLVLGPQSTTNTHLSGRITPKTGADLAIMGELFTNFLQSQKQTLSIRGDSVQASGSNVSVAWLSSAFQSLTLNITLPGQTLQLIQSIDMSTVELVVTEQSEAFAPLASSKYLLAQYKNPFGFSLRVVQSSENITLATGGVDVAQLVLPQTAANGDVSTGNVAPLVLSFENQTLRSLDDTAFSQFFAAVTTTPTVELQVKGSADVLARASIGDVPISGISVDVTSSMKGINAFNHGASLNDFAISGSGQDDNGPFITAQLTTTLSNPSNISLQTVGVEFPVYYQDVMLGRAVIDQLNLQPGDNPVPAEFRYAPTDANNTIAQSFIADFLQSSKELGLTIKGDANSSPFASLVPALQGLEITTSLKGLNFPPFVTSINAYGVVLSLFTSTISIDFNIANPLDTEIEIMFAQADSGINGETYVHFEHAFNNFVVPPHSTVNSGIISNVLLTKGSLGSLPLLGGKIDVFTAATIRIGAYTIPWLHLTTLSAPLIIL